MDYKFLFCNIGDVKFKNYKIMKSRIEDQPKKVDFPKLMISEDGLVVLFHEDKCGVVVYSRDGFHIGNYSEEWDMDEFSYFEGELTLSNV